MSHHNRRRNQDILIALPGTKLHEPGWHKPPPGTILTWTINGPRPTVAVKQGNTLLATGLRAQGIPA